jgi:hypothetical protein
MIKVVDINEKVPRHDGYYLFSSEWQFMRDSLRGNTQVKAQGELYLPAPNNIRPTAASPNIRNSNSRMMSSYKKFLNLTDYPDLTALSLKGMLGLAFSDDSFLQFSRSIESMRENATGAGDSFSALYRNILSEILLMGRVGALVTMTQDAEPIIQLYSTENIIDWEYDNHGNIQSVILREFEKEFNEKDFTYSETPNYIGLYLNSDGQYTQHTYDEDFNLKEASVISWGSPLGHIPFYILSAEQLNSELKDSILSPIAHKCRHIYRNTAILNKSLATKGDPTLYIIGVNDEEVQNIDLGANNIIALRNSGAKVGFAEIDGAGVRELREQIEDDIAIAQAYAGKILDVGGNASGESLKQRRLMAEISLTGAVESISTQITHILQETAFTLRDFDYSENSFEGFSNFTNRVSSVDDLIKASALIPQGVVSKESIHNLAIQNGLTKKSYEDEQQAISDESGLSLMNSGLPPTEA